MSSQKSPAAGFERRPSAEGKQLKWAQDTDFEFERRPSDASFASAVGSEREVVQVDQALELLRPDHIGSKCTDVFLRTASGCGTTTSSSATAKSCAATAMELLFPDEEPAARFSRDEITKSNAMTRIWTLATASSPCRPFTVCFPDEETGVVQCCGIKLSVEDFLRAQKAATGELEKYKGYSEKRNAGDANCEVESPLSSPSGCSPISRKRGQRLQRRLSRARGLSVEGESSDEEMDVNQLEYQILDSDAAEVLIDEEELQFHRAASATEEAAFTRFASDESVKSATKMEMKTRKKKNRGHHAKTEEAVARASSGESQASTASRMLIAGKRVKNALKLTRAFSSSRTSSTAGLEIAPRELTGEMKIAALHEDMKIEVIEAAESRQTIAEADLPTKTFDLDLDGANEVADVVKVLEKFAEAQESQKYLTIMLGRTGFGTDLRHVQPHLHKLSTITALGLNNSVPHLKYLEALREEQPIGLKLSHIFLSMLAPPPMTCLTELTLANNFLRTDGAEQLHGILMHNSLLTSLDLSGNDFYSKGLAPIIGPLSSVCTHLRSLSLSGNWIGCDGVESLSPVFASNPSLVQLNLAQNGIAESGCMSLARSMQRTSMRNLAFLDISQNRVDETAEKYLFTAIISSSSLGALTGLTSSSLALFYEYIVGKIAAIQKHIPKPSSELITALDLSKAALDVFPMVLLELQTLEVLDLSYNAFQTLPYIELCALSSLKRLECRGNQNLKYPSSSVIEEGGERVMAFIREALREGHFNIAVLLILVGDVEAGKTSLLRALKSPAKKCGDDKYQPTVAPELSSWTPEGQEDVLDIRFVDTSGHLEYAVTHEFFTAPSSVFLFVWRLEQPRGRAEAEVQLHFDEMVSRWISKLHFSTPGALILAVATHVDTVGTEVVRQQNEMVQRSIKRHIFTLHQTHPGGEMLKIMNDGKSMNVGSLKGFGVQNLSDMIVEEAKRVWLWGHPLSQEFRALEGYLSIEKERSKAVEITWKEFKQYAIAAGYATLDDAFRKAIRMLHDLYYIRYFGDIQKAWSASDDELASNSLLGTVYIDIEWCASAFRGIIRHHRDALLKFFGGRIKGLASYDKQMLNLSKRITVEGVLHQTLCPFIWPQDSKSKPYWDLVRQGTFGKIEQDLWPEQQGNTANSTEDYIQITNLLLRFGVMARISVDEFFVPFMKTNSHRRTIDSRAVAYNDCPYLHKFYYKSTPEHFFWRLSVSLAATFKENQIGLNFSAHYNRGTKVLLSFAEGALEHVLLVRSTHRREVESVKECVSALEKKYPGLRRIKRANMDRSEILKLEPDQAVQVFLSHSSEQQDESERLKTMLLDLDASLQIYTSHSHRNDAKNIPLTRVFIPLLDDRYHRSKRCCKEFADAYAQGCSIIPLVLGQFEFPRIDRADPASKINFKEWWPRNLSGMARHSLFINFSLRKHREMVSEKAALLQKATENDMNTANANLQLENAKEELAEAYKRKVEHELYEQVAKVLDRWRCSEPPGGQAPHGFGLIACKSCLSMGRTDPDWFRRDFCVDKINEWMHAEIQRRGNLDKTFSDPYLSCKYGHGNIASSLISDADGFESVLCCRCVAKNNFPVSAFNYQQIMKQFQERCIYTQGDFECHYCTADDGQLNVLDILQVSMYREYWRLWRGYFTAVY